MSAAWNDLLVDLDGDPAFVQTGLPQQRKQGDGWFELPELAIHM